MSTPRHSPVPSLLFSATLPLLLFVRGVNSRFSFRLASCITVSIVAVTLGHEKANKNCFFFFSTEDDARKKYYRIVRQSTHYSVEEVVRTERTIANEEDGRRPMPDCSKALEPDSLVVVDIRPESYLAADNRRSVREKCALFLSRFSFFLWLPAGRFRAGKRGEEMTMAAE